MVFGRSLTAPFADSRGPLIARGRASERSLFVRFLEACDVAHGAARAVKPFALPAEGLVAGPLPDVLWGDAVAGLAVGVVGGGVGVSRAPRSAAPQGAGRRPQAVRGPPHETFVFVRGHAHPPPIAFRPFTSIDTKGCR